MLSTKIISSLAPSHARVAGKNGRVWACGRGVFAHSGLWHRPNARHAHVTGSSSSSATVDVMGDTAELMDFGSHSLAFSHKSTREILRGLLVLNACALDPLVTHSYKLLTVGERLVGERLLQYAVAPFYNQFVAGDTEERMGVVSRNLGGVGVRLMIAPVLETDVGEGRDLSSMYHKNLTKTIQLIRLSRRQTVLGGSRPICQTKHTAHLSADILARLSNAYEALTEDQRLEAVKAVAEAMKEAGEAGGVPSSSHSLTPLALSSEDAKEVLACLPRLYQVGDASSKEEVILTVDAEYTYTNPAINLLSLAMMAVFNPPSKPPVVWNTYQGYLKAGYDNLTHDLRLAGSLGIGFGAKVVRGAYLERERSLAQELGCPDPVNDTYEDTSRMYDSMVRTMLGEVARNPSSRSMIVASHNEDSVRAAVGLLTELGLDPQNGNVVFGQVYGMAENISVPLARAGYLVYKSVPSGSMSEVMPYLSRRANENRAVLKGARRERTLLTQELMSRVLPKRSSGDF